MDFAARLARLPPVESVLRLELCAEDGQREVIENRPGSAGSVRVYAYLAARHGGRIDSVAASEGLDLYAEHSDDARLHPGKHPNIDRLLTLIGTHAYWTVTPITG